MLDATQMVLDPGDQPDYDHAVALCRAGLGDERYEALRSDGAALSRVEAIALARARASG